MLLLFWNGSGGAPPTFIQHGARMERTPVVRPEIKASKRGELTPRTRPEIKAGQG